MSSNARPGFQKIITLMYELPRGCRQRNTRRGGLGPSFVENDETPKLRASRLDFIPEIW